MNRMRTALFVFAVFSLVVGLRSEDEAKWVKRHEHEWQMWGTFVITPSAPIGPDGWRLTVKFAEPIRRLEVWQAKIVSSDKTEFVLESQHWNAELEAGKTLSFPFTVTKRSKRDLKGMEVSFERLGEGSGLYEAQKSYLL